MSDASEVSESLTHEGVSADCSDPKACGDCDDLINQLLETQSRYTDEVNKVMKIVARSTMAYHIRHP